MIIADKAYACLPQVIPNFKRRRNLGAYERRKRSHFNKILRRHRAIVENSIGALKMGFQILKNPIRARRKNVSVIAMTCVVLHNFLIDNGRGLRDEFEQLF